MTYQAQKRNTLRKRLQERAETHRQVAGAYAILGRKANENFRLLSGMAASPIALAQFDAWLSGSWEPFKDGLCGAGIAFAAREFEDGTPSEEAFALYRDIFLHCDED